MPPRIGSSLETGFTEIMKPSYLSELTEDFTPSRMDRGLHEDFSAGKKNRVNDGYPNSASRNDYSERRFTLGIKPVSEQAIRIIPERMEQPVVIVFSCPPNVERKEFVRQIKGQERGLNSQSLAQNIENRERYQALGRAPEGAEAQLYAREKALAQRIETNQKNGMTYSEAKLEAGTWLKTQAALHNPDQIAGGDPTKVSRMGDAAVNSSIGAQWRVRVSQLGDGVSEYAKSFSAEELKIIKMNVKLEVK